jgi:hypothetical protein
VHSRYGWPSKDGAAGKRFPKSRPKGNNRIVKQRILPTDSMTLNQNLLIVNTGAALVLFDTRCGVNQSFGHVYRDNRPDSFVSPVQSSPLS